MHAPQYKTDIRPFGEQPHCGPWIRRLPARPGRGDIEVRNRQRQVAERSECAGHSFNFPLASGSERQVGVQRRLGNFALLSGRDRARNVDSDEADCGVRHVHFEEREKAPLEIAQIAFEARKAIADPRLQSRRHRISRNQMRRRILLARFTQGRRIAGNELGLPKPARGFVAHCKTLPTVERSTAMPFIDSSQ